jgi:hypothetical protein
MMWRRARGGVFLPIVMLLAACGPASASNAPATPTPRGFDLTAWDVTTTGTGPVAMEANGGVDLFIPATTKGDSQHATLIALVVTARCHLAGDFDLQADYSLSTWPSRNGVRFGLVAGADSVERTTNPVGIDNTYATNLSGAIVQLETTDTSGRLRLARVGNATTGYYLKNGSWVSIASATTAATGQAFAIQAWTDAYTFHKQDVRVNLKHVTMTGCS